MHRARARPQNRWTKWIPRERARRASETAEQREERLRKRRMRDRARRGGGGGSCPPTFRRLSHTCCALHEYCLPPPLFSMLLPLPPHFLVCSYPSATVPVTRVSYIHRSISIFYPTVPCTLYLTPVIRDTQLTQCVQSKMSPCTYPCYTAFLHKHWHDVHLMP